MKNLLFTLIVLFAASPFAHAKDPFKEITLHKFKNGLNVILVPNEKSEFVQIKVNVGVGFIHENKSNYGVSHLLEHVLFRNTRLKDDMSYLQVIKEKDGTANGTTSWDQTTYYATVQKENAKWIVDLFHEMIMKPTLDKKHVETEKKTVLLEIGEPGPVAKVLGFDVTKKLMPSYLDVEDFWEEYFKVKTKKNYSNTEEQLATLKLTKSQIDKHYKKFYDPSNMQIVVSGNFNRTIILNQLVDLWGQHPTRNIGYQRIKYNSQSPTKSFKEYDIATSFPRITLGYLVNDVTVREKEVLLSYVDYLSHRLMKKLRNIHGETYTAHDRSHFKQNFGYFAVTLQTSKEKYKENLETVRRMMSDEAYSGKLSDQEIDEAKRLYLNRFLLWGQNVGSSARLGERMFEMNEQTGLWETPFEILNSVTPEQYKLILKKYTHTNLKYEMIQHPELFFLQDIYVLSALFCLGMFFMFRNLLQRPFANDQVKWVRKVRFPPLKMMEIFVGFLIFIACAHSFFLVAKITDHSIFQHLGPIGAYIKIPIWLFSVIASAQAVVSYFPRKLYVMSDKLVIKSLSYYSRVIPMSDIKSVKVMSLWKLLASPSLWFRLWNSFHYYDIKIWKPGMMIELKNGKRYFFSTKDSHECSKELHGLMNPVEVLEAEIKEAA